ncbi:helicase-related protein [Endozoicomonas montiporae]|uniref:Helicase domain-containing protein n=1 Tax=Endozoicomonas montiporae CL-33 TaxID=570277 RepID=A0A142B8B2_9GAMM|nr:helicase-related protein [Endozoicomonas montiporae]AMO54988.1 helicase domain-containing protein [Endozoicomonas montiporae CL-33]
MADYTKARLEFVNWVKQCLTGEKLKDDLLFETNPFNRYTTGILYPTGSEYESDDQVDEEDSDTKEVSSAKKTKYQPPSSMGFSFYIDNTLESLRVFFSAVRFKDQGSPNRVRHWEKHPLVDDGGEEIEALLEAPSKHVVCQGRARVDVNVRPHGDGKIVTVTLSNIQQVKLNQKEKERDKSAENSLFEAQLRCFLPENALRNYPRVSKALLTEEEQELELRYKDEHVYAIGHGVATNWSDDSGEVEIFSEFMPTVEVPQVTANTSGQFTEVLSFEFLKSIQSNSCVFDQLDEFVDNYSDWIETQEDLAASEEDDEQDTAHRLISRMETAEIRMRSSISLLRENEDAQLAFSLANQAMLAQMKLGSTNIPKTPYSWRPFQLAFFLMALESSINEDCDYRDWVDLIWFPTGGGKTEAYLGVMAFVFVYRRLKYSASGGGTTAIMRYTLRLLTSQQFVRACKVVSALELIRRETPALGEEPYSVGLWLGGESSPNTFIQALDEHSKGNFSKFVLQQCPWCATAFTKENYKATETSFHLSCSNQKCSFGCDENNILPFNVVDEALYQKPPSLLIATVDKFARLPWENRAGVFFGGNTHRPPELIIQDELHLISGALGSIVGIYEVGLEAILVSRGVYPKFIASTATIRQASEQVKALFGRDMAVFPPVGLRQKDSYFAREVPLSEKPGRLYVGYMAFGRQRQNCLDDLAGTLVAAPQALFYDQAKLKDAWWTQLIYHGSLKGVGNSRTNFQSGIPRIQNRMLLSNFFKEAETIEPGIAESLSSKLNEFPGFFNGKCPDEISDNQDFLKLYKQFFPARELNIKSLTSNQTADANAKVFDSLSSTCEKDDALDATLATNMVSVGLDEPRLALMVINGQPLTTAEYIQASSRVGRGKTPGIVFANYYKTQARSLSHYENFRAYHRSFYRFVEPSSLTPFTSQVRSRALHAALVSAVRHCEHGLLENTDAQHFAKDQPEVAKVLRLLKVRIKHALNGRKATEAEVLAHLDRLAEEWEKEASEVTNLRYKQNDKSTDGLLAPFEDSQFASGLWKTLNSMRNVEKTALFEVAGDKYHD